MNDNEFEYYTNEVNPFKNDTVTLSIMPEICYADEKNFNKVFNIKETKIKFDLNDFF